MRFRRRSFGRARKPREPVMQDRRVIHVTANTNILSDQTSGQPLVSPIATLWNPTDVVAGMQDLRLTMRRLRVSFVISTTITGAGLGNGDIIPLYFGIALSTAGEQADPSVAGTRGQRDDWLWLAMVPQQFTGASPQSFVNLPVLRNIENQPNFIDIRTQRKLEQDEVILLYAMVLSLAPNGSVGSNSPDTLPTAATLRGQVQTSVVYERTMRR